MGGEVKVFWYRHTHTELSARVLAKSNSPFDPTFGKKEARAVEDSHLHVSAQQKQSLGPVQLTALKDLERCVPDTWAHDSHLQDLSKPPVVPVPTAWWSANPGVFCHFIMENVSCQA